MSRSPCFVGSQSWERHDHGTGRGDLLGHHPYGGVGDLEPAMTWGEKALTVLISTGIGALIVAAIMGMATVIQVLFG
jgi:hypothetical protein